MEHRSEKAFAITSSLVRIDSLPDFEMPNVLASAVLKDCCRIEVGERSAARGPRAAR